MMESQLPLQREDIGSLVDAHRARLRGFVARKVSNHADVEDIVQETCLEAVRCAERFKGDSQPETWLFGIAKNLTLNHYRLSRKDDVLDHPEGDEFPDRETEDISIAIDRRRTLERICQLIDTLPGDMRDAFMLVCEGASYDDAAARLGVPIGTIRSRVARARNLLKAGLESGRTEGEMQSSNGKASPLMLALLRSIDAPAAQAVISNKSGQREKKPMMKPLIERITDLIAERPGIRNVEIADALEIESELVRPSLQPRIQAGRILVEKVMSDISQREVNAYRINPDWKPDCVPPVQTEQQQDRERADRAPVRQKVVPQAEWSAVGHRPEPAPDRAREAEKVDLGTTLVSTSRELDWKRPDGPSTDEIRSQSPEDATKPDLKSDLDEFTCAVFHDGRAEIKADGSSVMLTCEQAAIVVKHLGKFSREATQ